MLLGASTSRGIWKRLRAAIGIEATAVASAMHAGIWGVQKCRSSQADRRPSAPLFAEEFLKLFFEQRAAVDGALRFGAWGAGQSLPNRPTRMCELGETRLERQLFDKS